MFATMEKNLAQRYVRAFPNSGKLYDQAKDLFPSGVTHDGRFLQPFPLYIERAEGAYKYDVDGHQILDYFAGHGALILGHGHPDVVRAVQGQMARATHPGGCHELEIEWATLVRRLVPSAERIRFTSSGTEATLMALRLARIFTGKPKVLKFAGHFHGWNDFVVPAADAPFDGNAPPGIPDAVASLTAAIPPNDPRQLEDTLRRDSSIGCVILETTGGHWGSVPIRGDFLLALRDITSRLGRLLIFDEVITGFRVHPGGAQAYYGVTPDLTALAKILAGGLPGGCCAGRADIMEILEFRPGKPKMKHPGTFNANPLSAAAGIAALRLVASGDACERANQAGRTLRRLLNERFARRDLDWVAYGDFSMVKLLPNYQGMRPTDDSFIPHQGALDRLEISYERKFLHGFRQALLLEGVDFPNLGGLTSAAMSDADLEHTAQAIEAAIVHLRAEGLV